MIPPQYKPVSFRAVLPMERETGDVAIGLDTDGSAENALRLRLSAEDARLLINQLEDSLSADNPRFVISEAGFGSGWRAGDVTYFDLKDCLQPGWLRRIVLGEDGRIRAAEQPTAAQPHAGEQER